VGSAFDLERFLTGVVTLGRCLVGHSIFGRTHVVGSARLTHRLLGGLGNGVTSTAVHTHVLTVGLLSHISTAAILGRM
jgi:hypothetical protein